MGKFNFEAERRLLIDNLNQLKALDVEEYTLRKKWDELQNKIHSDRLLVHAAHDGIWQPTELNDVEKTIQDIESIRPKILLAVTPEVSEWWSIYRRYTSTAEYNQPPTRHIRFVVIDEARGAWPDTLGRALGIGSISGDFAAIKCRDDYIGWDQKTKNKMLVHSAVGSTIVPTQPFGRTFLGGKLMAALTTSAILRNQWQLQYGDVLAGLTTTSLYGGLSMYNSLPWWKALGHSAGEIALQPDDDIFSRWKAYVKVAHKAEYQKAVGRSEDSTVPVTGETTRTLSLIMRVAGIKLADFKHGHERSVYWSDFYENTRPFLRGEIAEKDLKLKPRFEGDVNAVLEWWKPRAIARYKKLKAEGRLNATTLFYNHGYLKDYKTFREEHLKHVGKNATSNS